jgi:hypothetical protein
VVQAVQAAAPVTQVAPVAQTPAALPRAGVGGMADVDNRFNGWTLLGLASFALATVAGVAAARTGRRARDR